MRSALFAPVRSDETERIGHLAESAIISQWQHSPAFRRLRYARWKNEGEVDVVYLTSSDDRPQWIGEIKWSDRVKAHFGEETKSVATLIGKHKTIASAFFTTKTTSSISDIDGIPLNITPSALYCYTVGRNVTNSLVDEPAVIAQPAQVKQE